MVLAFYLADTLGKKAWAEELTRLQSPTCGTTVAFNGVLCCLSESLPRYKLAALDFDMAGQGAVNEDQVRSRHAPTTRYGRVAWGLEPDRWHRYRDLAHWWLLPPLPLEDGLVAAVKWEESQQTGV